MSTARDAISLTWKAGLPVNAPGWDIVAYRVARQSPAERPAVDLSKAKAWDKVFFRCGGEAVIEKINEKTFSGGYQVCFAGDGGGYYEYSQNGEWGLPNQPFDIISIDPAPKPWSWDDVQYGQAFVANNSCNSVKDGDKLWFIAEHPGDRCFALFARKVGADQKWLYEAQVWKKLSARRAPEHDITVGE